MSGFRLWASRAAGRGRCAGHCPCAADAPMTHLVSPLWSCPASPKPELGFPGIAHCRARAGKPVTLLFHLPCAWPGQPRLGPAPVAGRSSGWGHAVRMCSQQSSERGAPDSTRRSHTRPRSSIIAPPVSGSARLGSARSGSSAGSSRRRTAHRILRASRRRPPTLAPPRTFGSATAHQPSACQLHPSPQITMLWLPGPDIMRIGCVVRAWVHSRCSGPRKAPLSHRPRLWLRNTGCRMPTFRPSPTRSMINNPDRFGVDGCRWGSDIITRQS